MDARQRDQPNMTSLDLRFSRQDWDRIREDWTAWWHHEMDRAMVVIDFNSYGTSGKSFVPQFAGWSLDEDRFVIDDVLDHCQQVIEKTTFYGDSWPRWWPNFGAGIAAGFLGSSLVVDENTVWFEPLPAGKLEEVQPRFDPENFWWRWVRIITKAAIERWDDQITVAVSDLGGNLDIIASLRGTENLLLDLILAPEEVDRLVAEISRLWRRYYDELHQITEQVGNGGTYWTPMWAPGRYAVLQSDLSYMISPAMFERFVLPDLEVQCIHLDYAFYHMDGKGQINHLEMLLAIEELRGVQWVPGAGAPPPEEHLTLLKRIVDAGKLCQVFTTADGALTITKELGGRGFAFVLEDPPSPNEIEGFLEALELLQT
jgi:hypothetical protein